MLQVLAAAYVLWPAFCGFLATSGPFALMLGLLRGLGLQRQYAACVLGVLWPVGSFLILGVASSPTQVWLALTCTYALLIFSMGLVASCHSWQKLSDAAIRANAAAVGAVTDGGDGGGSSSSNKTTRTANATGLAAADAAAAGSELHPVQP